MSSNPETDFGFRQVPVDAKKGLVREVFQSVAPRYDLMNDLMSLGIHRAWKRDFVAGLDPRPGRTLLDLAGGTGDIGFRWRARGGGPVVLSDINPAMLGVARERASQRGLTGVALVVADAEALPLPDASVDRISIAFGLRNCTDKDAVLREARRVLRPGGQFHCLEFSRVRVAALEAPYDTWSFRVLPLLGRVVAGASVAYTYLPESTERFLTAEQLAERITQAGFREVHFRRLMFGTMAVHWAAK
jgi:demethylmenaquinone methyltransferase/2-methoxy-6-polyprenyl-1,4-benzoquinol methylase